MPWSEEVLVAVSGKSIDELQQCLTSIYCVVLIPTRRFMPWPEEALTAVSGKFIDEFPMACSNEAKDALKVWLWDRPPVWSRLLG